MKNLLMLTLAATLLVSACGTTASDAVAPPEAADGAPAADAPAADVPAAAAPRPSRANPPPPAAPRETRATVPPSDTVLPAEPRERPAPAAFREAILPTGRKLPLRLITAVASDTSRVEDTVTAEFATAVFVDGQEVVPAGSQVTGIVTAAGASARVKGRAFITMQFTAMRIGATRYDLEAAPVSWEAPATKGEDAVKIGIGAGAGAAIGGLLGGKSGAARGAAVGGAAGTGLVLTTRGEEVRLLAGADASTELTSPLTVRLPEPREDQRN